MRIIHDRIHTWCNMHLLKNLLKENLLMWEKHLNVNGNKG